MEEKKIGIEEITKVLPAEWERAAKEQGAFGRSREIKSAKELLVMNLLYATSGGTIGGTSRVMMASGSMEINKNGVAERLTKSEKWLRYLVEGVSSGAGLLGGRPEWLGERGVIVCDTTTEESKDSKRTGWNLHYLMDIFTMETKEIKLTDEKTGEKLENFEKIVKDDIVIGDRAYGTIKSIEYAQRQGADYIFRLKSNAFKIYDEKGKEINVEKRIRRMRESAYKEFDAYYKLKDKLKPIHICIYHKNESDTLRSIRHAKISNGGSKGPVSENQKFFAGYVIVGTSLTESADRILELYRLRWQIELLFKRLKSIFDLDDLKAKKDSSVRVWFYSKLLLAAICEALDNLGRFSPSCQFSFVPRL